MCNFCELKEYKYSDDVPIGEEIKCTYTSGLYRDADSWCIVHENKSFDVKKPVIVVDVDKDSVGFDFTYCPICGRKVN